MRDRAEEARRKMGQRKPRGQRKQRGSVILGALLIVAVVTVLGAALMARQTAFVRTVQNDQTRIQTRLLLRTGVAWATALLQEDGRRTPIVRLDGAWAVPVRNIRFGDDGNLAGGTFSGQIEDAQGKFNLRNVIQDGAIDPVEVAAFVRLCATVGVKADVANRIVRRVVVAQPRGADADSAGAADADAVPGQAPSIPLPVPTVVPTQPDVLPQAPMIRTIDDLLSVQGVDEQVIARLRPVVTVLPVATWINANTVGPQVLAAWVPGMSLGQATALLSDRDQGRWFINRGDFANRLRRPDLPVESIRMGVTSDWFLVSGAVTTDRSTVVAHTLLFRGRTNEVRALWSREDG